MHLEDLLNNTSYATDLDSLHNPCYGQFCLLLNTLDQLLNRYNLVNNSNSRASV